MHFWVGMQLLRIKNCASPKCRAVAVQLIVPPARGVRKAADLTKPIDKRVYKVGTWMLLLCIVTCTSSSRFTLH